MHHRDTRSFTAESSGGDSATERPLTTSDTCSTTSASSSISAETLTALDDSDCRIPSWAYAEQPCSVSIIIKNNDIIFSIPYWNENVRLVSKLIHERATIRAGGRIECESSLCNQTLHALFANSDPREPSSISPEGARSHRPSRAITDGGEIDCDAEDESDSKCLGTIFIDITGTEELVDEQELDRPTRHLSSDGEDTAVSEYVSTVTKDDGLADSLPDGQPQE